MTLPCTERDPEQEGEEQPSPQPDGPDAAATEEAAQEPTDSQAEQPDGSAPAAAEGEEGTPAEGEQEGAEGAAQTGEEGAEGGEGAAPGEAPVKRARTPQIIRVLVPKVITKLHVALEHLPEDLAHCRAFYIIRSAPGKVAYEELDSMLECGVLSEGPSLRILEQVGPCT